MATAGYTPTIGLEIHAELKTRTKMFCASKNDADETRPNHNVCPVCMAYPGTLPVVNREAVLHVLKVGAAVDGALADYTEFDRKNYFYPDIPKGYQISQYEYPLVKGGALAGVAITRVHLEEDTANNKHHDTYSLIDFNRAGIPLMELVTEPVIHDADTASNFAKELQLLLRTLGAGEANMEKGQMRVEANISVSRDQTLGTKVEVKNLNSFRSVERAIAYEVERQIQVLEEGGTLVQETRGFDEDRGVTFSQRAKESSHDYRYFPEPDIPKFKLSLLPEVAAIKDSLPELPNAKRARYQGMGIRAEDAEVLVTDEEYAMFFKNEIEDRISSDEGRKLGVNYLISDIRGQGSAAQLQNISGGRYAKLIAMIEADTLSSRGAKDVLQKMLETGEEPETLASGMGVLQVTDTAAIERIVDEVIAENLDVAASVKAGKVEAVQFLVGRGMKKSKGSAKPALLKELIHKRLIQ